jgi:peptide/nickel transport system permease protein
MSLITEVRPDLDATVAPVEAAAPTIETAATPVVVEEPTRSVWRTLTANAGVAVSLLVILLAVGWAIVPGLFATHDPLKSLPGGLQAPSAEHWFGTDAIGRDLFSRVVHGAQQSLFGALVAVIIGMAAGTALGVLSGSFPGRLDYLIMRTVDVMLAIPGLLLALSIVILLGPGTTNVAIAVGVGSVASFARLVRSEVMQIRGTEYVEAARGSGARTAAILWRHVLPNSTRPVAALAALQFGSAILALSTLGFLGYGVTPPTPEWGMLIADGRRMIGAAWWMTALPGLVIVAVVLAANRISQWVVSDR